MSEVNSRTRVASASTWVNDFQSRMQALLGITAVQKASFFSTVGQEFLGVEKFRHRDFAAKEHFVGRILEIGLGSYQIR